MAIAGDLTVNDLPKIDINFDWGNITDEARTVGKCVLPIIAMMGLAVAMMYGGHALSGIIVKGHPILSAALDQSGMVMICAGAGVGVIGVGLTTVKLLQKAGLIEPQEECVTSDEESC
jgi:hypothetical protein